MWIIMPTLRRLSLSFDVISVNVFHHPVWYIWGQLYNYWRHSVNPEKLAQVANISCPNSDSAIVHNHSFHFFHFVIGFICGWASECIYHIQDLHVHIGDAYTTMLPILLIEDWPRAKLNIKMTTEYINFRDSRKLWIYS